MNNVMNLITDFSNTLKHCSMTVVFVNQNYFDIILSMDKEVYYLSEGDYKFSFKTKEELLEKTETYIKVNQVENIEIVGKYSVFSPGTLVYNK